MLQKLKIHQRDREGFTIIEVMIVLAIAGLIMLIVFLAVPALQRTARNTSRKNDASAIAGALANYIDDNGGALPTGIGDNGADTASVVFGTSGCKYTNPSWACNTEQAKLGFYVVGTGDATMVGVANNDSNVYFESPAAAPAIKAVLPGSEGAAAVSINTILVLEGYTCGPTATIGSPTANSRDASIYYVTETGTGVGALQCIGQ
jgi:prepilin-type N-terminal cleavage/methylation domain-containing protein